MWCYACSLDVRGDLTLNSMTRSHSSVTLLTSRDLTWSSGRLTRQHASHISVVAHISWGVTNVSSALRKTLEHVTLLVRLATVRCYLPKFREGRCQQVSLQCYVNNGLLSKSRCECRSSPSAAWVKECHLLHIGRAWIPVYCRLVLADALTVNRWVYAKKEPHLSARLL